MQHKHALAVVTRNPFQPESGKRYLPINSPISIQDFISKKRLDTQQAFIILANGKAILRADWHRTIPAGAVINVVYLPAGGGDAKKILGAVLTIALIAVAPIAAGAIGASMGVTGAVGLGMIQAGVTMAGAALIQSIGPKPEAPNAGRRDIKAASPTYSLSAQGNTARIGEAIPVIYGTHQVYPSFAAMPWSHFNSSTNDQYLYQVMLIGQGEYQVKPPMIEDSHLMAFPDSAWGVAYFDKNGNRSWVDGSYDAWQVLHAYSYFSHRTQKIVTATEVSGSELIAPNEDGHEYLGPFVVNLAGSLIKMIQIDIVCPKGLFYANDDGSFKSKKVEFITEYRSIDENGASLGSWMRFTSVGNGSISIKATTNEVQRRTYSRPVSAGRYQVRMKRIDNKDTSSRAGHDVFWAGLKGELVTPDHNWRDVTVLYTRLKASSGLSNTASRKINLIVQRKLNVPGQNYRATNSIAAALLDVCQASYGANLNNVDVDLQGLEALERIYQQKNWEFNAVFDTQMSTWDALKKIAAAGLAVPVQQGNRIRFIIDQPQNLPTAGFRMDNISKGSFSMQVIPASDATAIDVQAVYRDAKTWREMEWPYFDADQKPAKLELFGVTKLDQVKALVAYTQRRNKFRRRVFKFETEMGGLIPTYGDLISITHDLPARGQSVLIDKAVRVSTGYKLFFNADLDSPSTHIAFEKRDGGVTEPISLRSVDYTESTAVVDQLPDRVHIRDDGTTGASIGSYSGYTQLALVKSTKPRANGHVEIEAFNYDERVYEQDSSDLYDWYGDVGYQFNSSNGQLIISWDTFGAANYYWLEVVGYQMINNIPEPISLYSGRQNDTQHSLTLTDDMWVEARVIARGGSISGYEQITKSLITPTLRRFNTPQDIVWEHWRFGQPFNLAGDYIEWKPAQNATRYVVTVSVEIEEMSPPHYVPTRVHRVVYDDHVTTQTRVSVPINAYHISINVRAENNRDSETFSYSS